MCEGDTHEVEVPGTRGDHRSRADEDQRERGDELRDRGLAQTLHHVLLASFRGARCSSCAGRRYTHRFPPDRGGAEASSIARVDVLLVSPDERSRQLMALAVRSIERRLGEELRFRAAANGELGTRAALRDRPDMIVADEIASREGAFGLAKTLRDHEDPYTGVIVILLERKHDAWLAKWSGADAWFVKPVDPFELADRLLELVTEPKTEPKTEPQTEKESA